MTIARRVRTAMIACGLLALAALPVPAAAASGGPASPRLRWHHCGTAANVVCADVRVPRDYSRPGRGTIRLHVAKSRATDRAHRIGPLFINPGGPGGSIADTFETGGAGAYPALNARYDIIAMDPRGVGQSKPSIDCRTNQETRGIYSEPFTTPFNLDLRGLLRKDLDYVERCLSLNRGILPYVTTGNVARDIDRLRHLLGERRITYFGYSYGTFIGATYASLFPRRYRRMVLDGPVDATDYINDPLSDLSVQTTAFERALDRFMQACAADQVACRGFGGSDPLDAYDQLIAQADRTPIPAPNFAPDPRPVTGDDLRYGPSLALYNKASGWPALATALAAAANGDGSAIRGLVDLAYGNNFDGTFDPLSDRYFTIGAVEQRYPNDIRSYLVDGKRSWSQHEHFSWNNGYTELNYGLYPVRPNGAFYGPFRIPRSSPTPLVVATTYDPATPYRGALSLVRDLGNARLLTMRGDGHTAYPGNSACIDAAVEAYLDAGTLSAPGTSCKQDVGFAPPPVAAGAARIRAQSLRALTRFTGRLHMTQRPPLPAVG